MRGLFAITALLLSCATAAQQHSAGECREGGDFIRNAALSRDAGTTRESFVQRLEDDLETIRSFPAALRWFVRNRDDELFLRGEVYAVFDTPQSSERHRQEFLERCARRAGHQAGPSG